MDVANVQAAIKRVIARHRQAFTAIGSSQSKLLELASITGFAEHYKANGYVVTVRNPKGKKHFSVKTSTNGDPWNFSYFVAVGDADTVEIHMNLKVRSAHDQGTYCVDVGVVKSDVIPVAKPAQKWICVPNGELVTFGEAKKLVVYPMLLAQFVGIVHEIKPKFLNRSKYKSPHPPPTLIALGHFSGNAQSIVKAYPARKIVVNVAENYDMRLARVRASATPKSPFGSYGAEVL